MPLRAIARLIQTMLYARRFFPYYVYNILGGIEEDGPSITRFISHPLSHLYGQVPVRSTRLIPLARMSVRHVVQQAPHSR